MSAVLKQKTISYQEYLDIEAQSEVRYEYYYGEIFAMAGSSKRHNRLVQSISRALFNIAQSRGCQVFAENVKFELSNQRHYVYPDVIYTCHPDDLNDGTSVAHPSLVVEVLSDSTESYDRSGKLQHYLGKASVQYYLLVSQNQYQVQCYGRLNDMWQFRFFNTLDQIIDLPNLGLSLSMSEIYEGITLSNLDPDNPTDILTDV